MKRYRVIKIRVLRKVFSKQFCFIRCRRQHLRAVEQRRYSRFSFVKNTISNSPEIPRAKFMGSNRLFCFIIICKFGSFKNSFQRLLACLSFTLESEDLFFGTNERSDFYELWQQPSSGTEPRTPGLGIPGPSH